MEPLLEPPDEPGAVAGAGALAAIGVSFFPHPDSKKQHTTEAINNHGRNMVVSNKFQKFQSAASPRSPLIIHGGPQNVYQPPTIPCRTIQES